MATYYTSLPLTLIRSSEYGEEISSQCIGFCNGSRPGGSARLGSRR